MDDKKTLKNSTNLNRSFVISTKAFLHPEIQNFLETRLASITVTAKSFWSEYAPQLQKHHSICEVCW